MKNPMIFSILVLLSPPIFAFETLMENDLRGFKPNPGQYINADVEFSSKIGKLSGDPRSNYRDFIALGDYTGAATEKFIVGNDGTINKFERIETNSYRFRGETGRSADIKIITSLFDLRWDGSNHLTGIVLEGTRGVQETYIDNRLISRQKVKALVLGLNNGVNANTLLQNLNPYFSGIFISIDVGDLLEGDLNQIDAIKKQKIDGERLEFWDFKSVSKIKRHFGRSIFARTHLKFAHQLENALLNRLFLGTQSALQEALENIRTNSPCMSETSPGYIVTGSRGDSSYMTASFSYLEPCVNNYHYKEKKIECRIEKSGQVVCGG